MKEMWKTEFRKKCGMLRVNWVPAYWEKLASEKNLG